MQTQLYVPVTTGAKLITLEEERIRCIPLDSREEWSFGRIAPGHPADIPLASKAVSRDHGLLLRREDQWYISCRPDTTNVTYHNGVPIYPGGPESRRTPVPLRDGDLLRIDGPDPEHPDMRGVSFLFTTSQASGRWASFPLEGSGPYYIGRDPSICQIVQPFPYISESHAMIERIDGQYYLSDCGSLAGTWRNHSRVEGRVLLQEKDRIGICDRNLFFVGNALIYDKLEPELQAASEALLPEEKPVLLSARIRHKYVKESSGYGRKELLRDVNIDIQEGTLVAILGTAGAGKSTLMNCLNGMETAGLEGQILYRGQDLVQNFSRFQYLIGSVPQKKTFHPTYTPEQEFTDAAILRMPRGTGRKEIQRVVDNTIQSLHMDKVRKTKNSRLSGGEQTRVNLGIELVADRALLCLDEPDQGLSPDLKHEVFVILRELAHRDGRCILAIIHDVSEIDLFDQVIILVKSDNVGRLAFSGTPEEARSYFGTEIKNVYSLLEKDPDRYIP